MKKIKSIEELPAELRAELDEANAEDITLRYNNAEYHDPEITEAFLQEHGYELS